jgi:dihydroorotate dehydrogenase electron transfer subunit
MAQELQARGGHPRVFYGGKSEADLPLLRKFAARKMEVLISTDDGSAGFRGLVTAMFEKELARSARPAMVYACGPDPMMKRVGEIAAELKIPAELSLESVMGCGIGACWGCVHKIRKGGTAEWVKICEEGPVFPASEVVWAEDK